MIKMQIQIKVAKKVKWADFKVEEVEFLKHQAPSISQTIWDRIDQGRDASGRKLPDVGERYQARKIRSRALPQPDLQLTGDSRDSWAARINKNGVMRFDFYGSDDNGWRYRDKIRRAARGFIMVALNSQDVRELRRKLNQHLGKKLKQLMA